MSATKMAAVAATLAVAFAQTATAKDCFQDFALAASLATDAKGTCGAVQQLVKCAAGTDAAAQAGQLATLYKCDPSGTDAAPTLTAYNNHLTEPVNKAADVKFYRFRRETTSIFSLSGDVAGLEKSKANQKDVDGKLATLQSSTTSKLASVTASVDKTTKDLKADLAKQSGVLDKSIKASLLDINGKMDKLSKDLDALLTKQINDADVEITKALKTVGDKIAVMYSAAGDCNYATHFKDPKSKKCVQFRDCSLPASTYVSSDGRHQEFLPAKHVAFPSFIWRKGTKDKDHVCGKASWRRWYKLSDHVVFMAVPWPEWLYPSYGEMALINVCKLAGLQPWRDQSAWGCNPGQYSCDTWGYNLGGHDLINNIANRVRGRGRTGHSGDMMVSKEDLADDFGKMGFAKGTTDIVVVTKQSHSGFDHASASHIVLDYQSNGQLKYKSGSTNGQPKSMANAVAMCTYGYN